MPSSSAIQVIMTRKGLDFDQAVRFYWYIQEGYTQENAMKMLNKEHPKRDNHDDYEEHPK
jgi:hypothetical protein